MRYVYGIINDEAGSKPMQSIDKTTPRATRVKTKRMGGLLRALLGSDLSIVDIVDARVLRGPISR